MSFSSFENGMKVISSDIWSSRKIQCGALNIRRFELVNGACGGVNALT